MAATDIQYGNFDPVLYTPDYTFLKYVLDKKTGQYEQGLKSVSSSYNNLKKQLSDPMNVKRRDEYLKAAEGQLQKVAFSDLSLQENVNAANAVFEPMLTDKAFIFDSYHTERINNQKNIMLGWRDSEDPEQRKKFNQEIYNWVNRDLNSIINGNGNVENYKKVEGRNAFAYIDPQDIINQDAKDSGFKFEYDVQGRPYIVTTTGGPSGTKNYESFARNSLLNNPVYQRQTEILATSRQERVLEEYKSNPETANLTNDQIFEQEARKKRIIHRDETKQYLTTTKESIDKETAEIRADELLNREVYQKGMLDINNGNSETPEAKKYLEYTTRAEQRNQLQTHYNESTKNFNETFGENEKEAETKLQNYVNLYKQSPFKFYYNLQLQNDVTRFSNMRAASVSRKIKQDEAYVSILNAKNQAQKTAANIENMAQDNLREDEKLQLQREKQLAAGIKKKKTVVNADGTVTEVEEKEEIIPLSPSATHIRTINNIKKLKDDIEIANSKSLSTVTDTYGAFHMLNVMGMDNKQVGILRNLYTKYNQQGKSTVKMTAEETSALSNAYSTIFGFGKSSNNQTFLEEERKNWGRDIKVQDLPVLLNRVLSGYSPKNENETKAMISIFEHQKANAEIEYKSGSLLIGKKAAVSIMSKDPAFKPILVERTGGATGKYTDILDETDVKGWLNGTQLTNEQKEEVAEAYVNGTIKIDVKRPGKQEGFQSGPAAAYSRSRMYQTQGTTQPGVSSAEVTDRGYTIVEVNDKRYVLQSSDIFKVDPKKYRELTKRVNEEISIPEWTTGKEASPRFGVSGETSMKIAKDLNAPSITNSNIFQYDEGTTAETQVEDEDQPGIRDALNNKDNIADMTILTASPLSTGGGQVVKVTFAPPKGKNDKEVWRGQTYYFPINVNSGSPEVFQIFSEVNRLSEYSPYQAKGETYSIDLFKGSGIKVDIIPDAPGSSKSRVVVYQRTFNPQTNTYSNDLEKIETEFSFDVNNISFTEVQSSIYSSYIFPYMTQKMQYEKQKKIETANLPKFQSLLTN